MRPEGAPAVLLPVPDELLGPEELTDDVSVEEPVSEEVISEELDDEPVSEELEEPISDEEPVSEEEPAADGEPVSEEEPIAEVSDWAADPAEDSTEPADVAAAPPLLPQALSTNATAAVPARATARCRRKPLRSQRTVITILVVRAPAVCGPSVALPRQPDRYRWGRDESP